MTERADIRIDDIHAVTIVKKVTNRARKKNTLMVRGDSSVERGG